MESQEILKVLDVIWECMDFDTYLIITDTYLGGQGNEEAKKQYKIALATGLGNLSVEKRLKIITWALKVKNNAKVS